MVNVLVGKSVTLECESNAVPPPTITWYKNGRAVTESGNVQLLAKGQMLHIKGSEVRHDSLLSSVYTDVCVTTRIPSVVSLRCLILDSTFAKPPMLLDKWTKTST